jgi:hypothetical protein
LVIAINWNLELESHPLRAWGHTHRSMYTWKYTCMVYTRKISPYPKIYALMPLMKNVDLELTDQDFQIVVTKPEDFFDAEMEVATTHLDLIENGLERALEFQVARVMTRNRPNPNTTHPKILLDNQMIDEKAVGLVDKMLDCRERLLNIKSRKKTVVQRMA